MEKHTVVWNVMESRRHWTSGLRSLIIFGWVFTCPLITHAEPNTAPAYMEEGEGTTHVWLGAGPTYWFSDRIVHPQWLPTTGVLGVSHTIHPVRLAWRLRWSHNPDTTTHFVSMDLISIEKLYSAGTLTSYLRGGLAVGLDVSHRDRSFGGSGFFNEDLGNTGGPGVTLGAGLEMPFVQNMVVQVDTGLGTYGGVGVTAVSAEAALRLGYGF